MESTGPQSQPSANRQIARAAGTVMVAFILSQLAGLLAKLLSARAFGASSQLDAFYAANRLAEILFNLVAGGALGSAFIPTFTTLLHSNQRRDAWRLASAIANLILLILTALSALAAVFAPWVVRHILAPGFTDPAQLQLTVDMLRILLPSSIVFGLSGLVMGVLNAHQIFLFPALAPAMYSLGWIIGVVFLAPTMGIYGLAWGTLLGAVMHLALQLPRLFGLENREYIPTFGLNIPEVAEVARLMGPRLLGVAVVQLNFLLNTYLASAQPEGSLTGINLAFSLMLMPQAAIAQSIAVAALPTFSAQVALGRLGDMRSSLAATLRGILLLAIPATFGLILLRQPIIQLIYQGGQFGEKSTQLVSWALLWYGAGLVGHSIVEIISRSFYALHDTKTPVMVGVGAMTLNLAFSLLFPGIFIQLGWMPHGGLALANSLATALESVVLLLLMRRRLDGLQGSSIWSAAGKACLASLAMAIAILLWLNSSRELHVAFVALGGVLLGGLVYLLSLVFLKTREIQQGWTLVRSRIGRHP